MKENVGHADRMMRLVLGPALMGIGVGMMGRGGLTGVVTLVAGVLVLESGITRTCPLNHLAGIDTREPELRAKDETAAASTAEAAILRPV
jgi:uncharacterized membrane protein